MAAHWTPQVSIDDMDEGGVRTAITSITAPGLSFVKPDLLRHITRECNDYGARMAATGQNLDYRPAAEYRDRLAADQERFGQVIRQAGLAPN